MRWPTLASLSVLTLLTLAASCCWAFLPPAQERLPNFDKRNQPAPKAGVPRPEQTQAVAELRSRLPSARVDFDEITAAPAMIADVNGFLTGPDGQIGRASCRER